MLAYAYAPEAPTNPPLTQAEKPCEEQETRGQTAALGAAAALIRHIYQRSSRRLMKLMWLPPSPLSGSLN